MVLGRATCHDCQKITQAIEDFCLNQQFGPVRARLKLNRKDRPKRDWLATVTTHDGPTERKRIPINQIPASMIIPSLPAAGILEGKSWEPRDILLQQVVLNDEQRERNP